MVSNDLIPSIVLVKLCADAYIEPFTWERDDVHATLREVNGRKVVTFMGSKNLIDWWRDLQVLGNDGFDHPDIGPVHSGLYHDVDQIFNDIEATVGDEPVWYNGHSKGGGEAQIAAARRILAGKPVLGVSTCGAPRVGSLRGLISGYPGSDLWNYRDPVPDLPGWLPHPRETEVIGRMTLKNLVNPLSDHFISTYIEVVDKI